MRLSEMEKDLNDGAKMIEYFSTNFDHLPVNIQLAYGSELLRMMERVRPIYVLALALKGDVRSEATTDETDSYLHGYMKDK